MPLHIPAGPVSEAGGKSGVIKGIDIPLLSRRRFCLHHRFRRRFRGERFLDPFSPFAPDFFYTARAEVFMNRTDVFLLSIFVTFAIFTIGLAAGVIFERRRMAKRLMPRPERDRRRRGAADYGVLEAEDLEVKG
jgi:hypothetical protein